MSHSLAHHLIQNFKSLTNEIQSVITQEVSSLLDRDPILLKKSLELQVESVAERSLEFFRDRKYDEINSLFNKVAP
jgi:hypothetical protein